MPHARKAQAVSDVRSRSYSRRMDDEILRAVMRRFPAGLAVLTVQTETQALGATVGSLVSLSLEPPLIGVSLGIHAPLLEPVRDAGVFALSLLGSGQEAIAQRFGTGGLPPLAAWHEVETRDGALGPPLLADAAGWLECRVDREHAAGDHVIVVGQVVSAETGPVAPGVVYVDGAYRSL